MFLVGFDGKHALIDGYSTRKYGRKTTVELAELGFYKAAFCSALFSNSTDEQNDLVQWFKQHALFASYDFSQLKSLFGVFEVPSNIAIRTI